MLTISCIKADVGSIGGHTRPSDRMLEVASEMLEDAQMSEFIDHRVTFTGDDLCLLMSHRYGDLNEDIHQLAWRIFEAATDEAKKDGLYGAGQDLLVDAPSGNVRGAGPGVAEITFDEKAEERESEPFLVFAADKCGPGVFNFPFWNVFTNPMYCAGLMLPNMLSGFTFTVIDMDHVGKDRVIVLNGKVKAVELAFLLRDENKFGIKAIHSNTYPKQQVVSISTDRLHSIAGEYKGKDDPVAIVRVQKFFPAPEEVVSPWTTAHYTAGDARGSHHMPVMPVAISTPVTGSYCLPIVSCLAYSVNQAGILSNPVDMFGNPVWDATRLKAQRKGDYMREQGFVGAAMLPFDELEYSAFKKTMKDLDAEFRVEE